MATFAPLLLLVLLSVFLHTSSGEDRTYWNHVCAQAHFKELKSCELRGRSYNMLEEMSVTDVKEKISPAQENPQFANCWEYVYYKRNRTNDRFKKRVEDKVGDEFGNAIYRMLKYVGKISDHDNSIGKMLGAIKRWRKCVDLRSPRTNCDEEEGIMNKHLDEYYPDNKTENSTIHLKILRARMRHLKQRNWLRTNAVNLIRNFSNAVFESTTKMFDENAVSKEWDKKCQLEFGSAYWSRNVFATNFTLKISKNAMSLNTTFQEIEAIDQRAEEYLNVLKEFRTCESIKGKYEPNCTQIMIKADSIDPINFDDSDEERAAQKEIDKTRKKDLFKALLKTFGRGGLLKLHKEYTSNIENDLSGIHGRLVSFNNREIIDESGWTIEIKEHFRETKKEFQSIKERLETQYDVLERFAILEKCAQEEEFSCSYLARQIAKILDNN